MPHADGQRERWIHARVGGAHGWQGVSPLERCTRVTRPLPTSPQWDMNHHRAVFLPHDDGKDMEGESDAHPTPQSTSLKKPRAETDRMAMFFKTVKSTYAIEFITIWVILCLLRQEAQSMLRYRDIPTHTTEVLDLTSLTVDEFAALQPRQIVYCSFWSISSRIPFTCSMGACSACASPKRRNGCMSYSRCCVTPCVTWGMRPVAVWRPCANALGGSCRLFPWRRHRRQPSRPPPQQRPPFLS